MMLTLRRAQERGHADHGWLDSWHSFSFADYRDAAHMGFGNLRVINEDRIAGGEGFGTHGHRDMEILSYVLEGALAHADSLGNGGESGIIRPGDVQRMTAGTGVRHSEYNALADRTTHFLQIWLLPRHAGIAPGYEQRHFSPATRQGKMTLIASESGRDGSITLHADAAVYAGLLDAEDSAVVRLAEGRRGYVHVARGELQVNGVQLQAGDALKLEQEDTISFSAAKAAEVLVFDLA
jgi:quercetin 2,3-dioxygenase